MTSGTAAVSVGPGPDRPVLGRMRTAASSTASRRTAPGARPSRSAGRSASAPAATAWAVDQLQVFADVRATAQLWNRYWDGAAWHAWESLGGELDRRRRPPRRGAPTASTSGRPARDGMTWHRWWDGTRWVEWERLPR